MTTTAITIEGYKQLSPRVVNLFQENNLVDTIVFTLSPYIQDDVDLHNYSCYVVTYGVNGIDEQKLPFTVSDDTMTMTWIINNYTLSIGQTLSYQIVFKANDESAAVWHSYKGILLCNESIPADESIASNYPTILRQFELRIEEIAEKILFAYYWMPLGSWTPIHQRIKRRFYLNKQNDYNNACVIEDDSGNVVMPAAKSIYYEPGSYSISESLQNVIDFILRQLNFCTKFCVNDGNVTNGSPDILTRFSGTLGFKVGDDYLPLTAAQANGETFVLNSVQSVSCGSLPNNDYNVFLDKYGNVRLINDTIYRQHELPTSPSNGDVWYKAATNSAQIYNTSGYLISQISNVGNETIYDACAGGDTIIAISSGKVFRSTDGCLTWDDAYEYDGLTFCTYDNEKFFVGTDDGKLIFSSDGGLTWSLSTVRNDDAICGLFFNSPDYFAITQCGKVYSSTDIDVWVERSNILDFTLNCVCRHGDMFIACGEQGKVYRSTDLLNWAFSNTNTTESLNRVRWLHDNTWAICCPLTQSAKIFVTNNNGATWTQYSMDGTSTIDVAYENDSYVVTTVDKVLHGTSFGSLDVVPGENRRYNAIIGDTFFGSFGRVSQISDATVWYEFNSVPVGKITVVDGEITYAETFNFNQNWFDVNAETVATPTMFGALRAAGTTDEQTSECVDAAITPANIFRLMGYRTKQTQYSIGDVVGCPYHASLALKCTTAGTTSDTILDLTGELEIGDTITDGTVVWGVVPINGEVSAITTKGDLIVGNNDGKQGRLAVGSSGQFLKVSNGMPEWAAVPNPMTTAGDIIVGGTGGVQSRLGIGTVGQVMKVGSNNRPSWASGVVATLKYWS